MTQHTYVPEGVCSSEISFEIKDGVLRSVQFADGCSGNSQAISRLCEGMRVDDVIRLLKDIHCEDRGTSCPDQLSKALEIALNSTGSAESVQKP
jgi:uncharacterized protein (TIGR03905 family)